MTSRALAGIKVLDLTTGIAGPMAAMLLADFGADVVKVEPPSGDPDRALPRFPMLNRGKRSVVADAARPDGLARITGWVHAADLCLTGTGLLDAHVAAVRSERLVHLRVTPYLDHTPWVGGEESAGLLWSHVGSALRQSSSDGGPVDPAFPYVLYNQAIWASAVAVAALVERERSGRGQEVLVGGLHGAMIASAMSLVIDPWQPEVPAANGAGGPGPMYTRYRCADGVWLFMATLLPKFQQRALDLLGLGWLLEDARIPSVEAMGTPENRGWVRHAFAEVFATETSAHWRALFEQADVPIGPCLSRADWLDSEPVRTVGMRVQIDDPERGPLVMPGNPVVLEATPADPARVAPGLGAHDGDVDWTPSSADLGDAGAPASAPPLTGISVLDLGAVLAGPYAGMLLAELGADVVKVEVPAGDSWRDRGMTFIRGQQGLALDLTRPEGHAAFLRLAGGADVVLDNYRVGVLDRLGIDDARLREVNPDLVTMSITGFGPTGPLAKAPAFDPLLQALSGMMTAQGGDGEPVVLTVPVNDVTTATLAVLGIVVALYHRARTGVGQQGWVSLAGAAAIAQSEELVRYPGRTPAPSGGTDFRGPGPWSRSYATADGWIRIDADPVTGPADLAAGGFGEGGGDGDVEQVLADAFAGHPTASVLVRLRAAGIPAVACRRMQEIAADPTWWSAEALQTLTRPEPMTPLVASGRYARLSRTMRTDVMTPPGVGEHSAEVLAAAGFDEQTIRELAGAGTVRLGDPMVPVTFAAYR